MMPWNASRFLVKRLMRSPRIVVNEAWQNGALHQLDPTHQKEVLTCPKISTVANPRKHAISSRSSRPRRAAWRWRGEGIAHPLTTLIDMTF